MLRAPQHGWRVVEQFIALPTPSRAEVLVPTARRPATAALRRFSNGSGGGARLAAAATALAFSAGAGPLLRGRVSIAVDDSVADAMLPDLVLCHRLRTELRDDRLELAVRMAALRPNGKPVVQALSPDGSAIAFVKVGWNDLTCELVRREAKRVTELTSSAPPRAFRVPRPLWAGAWAGYEVLAVESVDGDPAALEPPLAATAELAAIGGLSRSTLAESGWWTSLRERAGGAGPAAPDGRGRLGRAFAAVERRHGTRELVFGTSHGDWTPWNMAVRDGHLQVWDWERCAAGVPVGIDVAHYLLLVRFRQQHRPIAQAIADAIARVPGMMPEVGADAAAGETIVELELLEMAVRYAEARAVGLNLGPDPFLDALLELTAG
jgi:hypothetical protein